MCASHGRLFDGIDVLLLFTHSAVRVFFLPTQPQLVLDDVKGPIEKRLKAASELRASCIRRKF